MRSLQSYIDETPSRPLMRIPLQIVGFIGCALGLGIAPLAAETIPEVPIIVLKI
jgi:hypothetical protein